MSTPTATQWEQVGDLRGPPGIVPGWYPVTAYGATGNGTTDDTAAIQAAIDAAPAGGIVWFPGGTYRVSTTIRLRPSLAYLGPGGRGQLAVVKAAPGLTGGAVMAALGWWTSATSCDNPIRVEGLVIDGSAVTGVHGLVVYNFWSRVVDVQVRNIAGPSARGIYCTDRGRNGSTVTTNSHSENTFDTCRFYDHTAGATAFWAESINGYSNQDGHLRNAFMAGIGGYGIRLGRAAGWSIVDNHLYGIGYDGISLDGCYATRVLDNYVEDFGGQNAANPGAPTYGYYNGISLATILNDRASVLAGNTVSTTQPSSPAGNRWACYSARAGSGQLRAHLVAVGNTAVFATATAPAVARSHAWWLGEGGDSGRLLAVEWSGNQIQDVAWWQGRRTVPGGATVALSEPQPASAALTQIAGLTGLSDGQLLRRVAGAWAAATLAKSDVGLGNVDNTADSAKPISTAQQAALDAKVNTASANQANGYPRLDASGLIPQDRLPAIALVDFLGDVASQAAMLALVGQRGDWCVRTDRGTEWQLIADNPTALASWKERTYPGSPVSSVNGRTGPVTGLAEASALAGYAPVNHSHTPGSIGAAAAAHGHSTGDITKVIPAQTTVANGGTATPTQADDVDRFNTTGATATLGVPSGTPADGNVINVELYSTGSATTVTIAAGYQRTGGQAATIPIPVGKVAHIALRYRAVAPTGWRVLAVSVDD